MSSTLKLSTSEIAYELLREHMDMLLELCREPVQLDTVKTRLGTTDLDFFLQEGLLILDNGEVSLSDNRFVQLRKESMSKYVREHYLPTVARAIENSSFQSHASQVRTLYLSQVDAEDIKQKFLPLWLEDIRDISTNKDDALSRVEILIVGTDNVWREGRDMREDAVEHIMRSAIQRSEPKESHRAIMLELSTLLSQNEEQEVLNASEKLFSLLEPYATSQEKGTFHFTFLYCSTEQYRSNTSQSDTEVSSS